MRCVGKREKHLSGQTVMRWHSLKPGQLIINRNGISFTFFFFNFSQGVYGCGDF